MSGVDITPAPRSPQGAPRRDDAEDDDGVSPNAYLFASPWTTEQFDNAVVRERDAIETIARDVTEEVRREVVAALIAARGLIAHQIDSYERFMDELLPGIVHENSTVLVDSDSGRKRHMLEFGRVVKGRPSLKEANGFTREVMPYECRMRNLTYAAPVAVDVTYTVYDASGAAPKPPVGAAAALPVGARPPVREDARDVARSLPVLERRLYREVLLCHVPVMLRSKYCHLHRSPYPSDECLYDRGGVFVINGSVKVVIAQEEMRKNHPVIFLEKQPSKYSHVCEVRSCHETKMRSTSTLYLYVTNAKGGASREIVINVPFIEFDIPLAVVYAIIGLPTPALMAAAVLEHAHRPHERDPDMEQLVHAIFETAPTIFATAAAGLDPAAAAATTSASPISGAAPATGPPLVAALCDFIGRKGTKEPTYEKRLKYVEHIFANEFLPHIGLDRSAETVRRKCIYLSMLVYQECAVLLRRQWPDDRDYNGLKCIDPAGTLLAQLFRPQWRTVLKNAAAYVRRVSDAGKAVNISDALNAKRITSTFKYAMSTGNWGAQKGGSTRTGVAQVHNCMTVTAALSNLRRCNMHLCKEGKNPKPRQLPLSVWGIYDGVETPEGQSCLAGDSEVLLPDGKWRRIDALPTGSRVLSVNPELRTTESTEIYNVFEQDPAAAGKTVYELVTATGRRIRATDDHPFFVQGRGRVPLREVVPGRDSVLMYLAPVPDAPHRRYVDEYRLMRPALGSFEEFRRVAMPSSGLLYIPVQAKWAVAPEPVHDFTTVSENHTFVANGFVVGNCGLTKALAIGCYVRAGGDPEHIIDALQRLPTLFRGIGVCSEEDRRRRVAVVVNGIPAGYALRPRRLVYELRRRRRLQALPYDTTILYRPDQRRLTMHCYSGCCIRPLFVVEHLHRLRALCAQYAADPAVLWTELMLAGVVEYVSKEEEYTLRVAIHPQDLLAEAMRYERGEVPAYEPDEPYTHVEIHPILLLGVCSALIPFLDSNQTPRNTYSSNMGRQSMAIFADNVNYRTDTVSHTIAYPQQPIVQTFLEKLIGAQHFPMTQNQWVAVLPWDYNQEDSICLNQSALERGNCRSFVRRTYRDEEKTRGTDSTRFERPPQDGECRGLRKANYGKLNERGFVSPGTEVEGNDVLIGKTTSVEEVHDPEAVRTEPVPRASRNVKRDQSLVLRTNEPATVDRVVETTNRESAKLLKVQTVAMRVPEIGDKFCLTPDHDVLTSNRGWVSIADVTLEDEVACLEDRGRRLAYRRPTRVYSYAHARSEPLYCLETRHVRLRTTLRHRMWVRDAAASAVPAGCEWATPTPYTASRPVPFEYGLREAGSLLMHRDVAYQCDVPSWWHDDDGNLHIDRGDHQWCSAAKCGVDVDRVFADGRLPDSVWSLEGQCRGCLRALVTQLLDRSGRLHRAVIAQCPSAQFQGWPFYAEQERLVDDVQRLCLHAGSLAATKQRHGGSDGKGWTLDVRFTMATVRPVVGAHSTDSQCIRYGFESSVHCIEVPEHVFLVRHEGRPVWTGNSSRHGQKGTVGMVYREEDLPFSPRTGMRPTAIINSHCMPSRMTVGMMAEMLLGKAAILDGEIGDGTPFSKVTSKEVGEVLARYGFQRGGKEPMIDGRTGEAIEADVFFAPVAYQRLKHTAIDKIHARARGPRQMLTRQPVEGRFRDGGFRLGEMEGDCVKAHGASAFLCERLFEQSDAYEMPICSQCGMIAEPARPEGARITGMTLRAERDYCRNCDSYETPRRVKVPYGFKLFDQELNGCNIAMRCRLTEAEEDAGGENVP